MSVSREERARRVLELAELAARNIALDGGEEKRLVDSWDAFSSKMRYLKPQAAAAWSPDFGGLLSHTHSMRVSTVDILRKEALRGFSGRCMACGRVEKNCLYAIDLVGDFDASMSCCRAEDLHSVYRTFMRKYQTAFDDQGSGLLSDDNGKFVVGETCLRKAVLQFFAQTLALDLCYAAEREVEDRASRGEQLDERTFYHATEEEAAELVAKQDALELAIANERHPLPALELDESLWSAVDAARERATRVHGVELDAMLRRRASERIASKKKSDNADRDSDFVVSDEDESESEQDSPKKPRKRRSCVIEDEGEGGSDDGRGDGGAPARKQPCPSAEGIAGTQRASRVLPARRVSLLQLMKLQTRLAEQERHADAAVCTSAILTMQDLLSRVDRF